MRYTTLPFYWGRGASGGVGYLLAEGGWPGRALAPGGGGRGVSLGGEEGAEAGGGAGAGEAPALFPHSHGAGGNGEGVGQLLLG